MTFAREESNFNTEDMAQNRGKLTTDAIAGAGKRDAQARADEAVIESRLDRANGSEAALEPLFDTNVDQSFRDRWREVQTGFVDEPRQAVNWLPNSCNSWRKAFPTRETIWNTSGAHPTRSRRRSCESL
jgi:hypothetical protein